MSVSVKGSTVTARIRWVRELYGEPGVKRLKEALAPEHRTFLQGRILPHEWVPFELFVAVCVELDRIYGKGDLELCREMGRYSAKVNLPTLYRIFYALGSPAFIMKRAARVWDIHYSSGRLDPEIVKNTDGTETVSLKLIGFETPHRAHCLSVAGWVEESVTLSGGRVLAMLEPQCRMRGDPNCEIAATWR